MSDPADSAHGTASGADGKSTLDSWGWSPLQRSAVLEALHTARNLRVACDKAGVSLSAHAARARGDEEYAAEVAKARDAYVCALADATQRDALDGYKLKRTTRRLVEGEMQTVEEVEQEHVDNTLRVAVLARLAPETWGRKDGALDITTGGKPLKRLIVEVDDDDPEPDPEQ